MKTILACFALAAVAVATSARADDPQAGLYTIKAEAAVGVGAGQTIALIITPAAGYKWNKDYPAKAQVPNGGKIEFAKAQFTKAEGDITGDDHGGKIVLKGTGKAAGTETLEATLSFSLCNEETCQVLRQRPYPLAVTVK